MRSLLPLLFLLIFLLVIAVMTWRKRLRLRALAASGGLSVPVLYHMQENLMRSMLTPQLGMPGVMLIEPGRFRFAQESGGQTTAMQFKPGACELTLIDTGSLLGIMPTLIRLTTPERSYYFHSLGLGNRPDHKATLHLHELLARQIAPQKRLRTLQLQLPPWVLAVALLPLLIGVGLIGYSLWNRVSDIGPSLVAGSVDGGVLAAGEQQLLRFDGNGELIADKKLQQFDLQNLSDLHMAEGDEFWVGDWDAGDIKLCNWQQESCAAVPWLEDRSPFRRAFKFLAETGTAYYYATDTARHRFIVFDENGKQVSSSAGKLPLCFPNGLTLASDGALYIADTNHHRIVQLPLQDGLPQYEAAQFIAMAKEPLPKATCAEAGEDDESKGNAILGNMADFSEDKAANALDGVRAQKVWPTDIVQDGSGRWWVLLAGNGLRHGDIVRFAPDWSEPQRVASVTEDSDISRLSRWREFVLATDTGTGEILRIDTETRIARPFGGAGYQHYFDAAGAERDQIEQLRFVGLAVVFLPLIILMFVLQIFMRRNLRMIRESDPHLRRQQL